MIFFRRKRTAVLEPASANVTQSLSNPNGIPTQSPGLRGTSYPGLETINSSTATRLWPIRFRLAMPMAATPLGSRVSGGRFPRVARSSQTWAQRCNPFGIGPNSKKDVSRNNPAREERECRPRAYAFTLIELLVVIAIIAILAALLL